MVKDGRDMVKNYVWLCETRQGVKAERCNFSFVLFYMNKTVYRLYKSMWILISIIDLFLYLGVQYTLPCVRVIRSHSTRGVFEHGAFKLIDKLR